jgi:hypothetical protein
VEELRTSILSDHILWHMATDHVDLLIPLLISSITQRSALCAGYAVLDLLIVDPQPTSEFTQSPDEMGKPVLGSNVWARCAGATLQSGVTN